MNNTTNRITDILMITLGTFLCASAIFLFLTPSHLAVAGMSGLSILLSKFIPLSVGTLFIILNVICLILSYIYVGKEFTYRTLYPSILVSVIVRVYEMILPNYTSIMGDALLDLISYLFLYGLGCAMLFVRNSSSGGLDIICKIINKYLYIEVGTAMSVAGLCISIPALFIYDLKTGVMSILGTYLSGMVIDHFIFGLSVKKKVCIVSEKVEEIRDYVINDMKSGATIYHAIGAFDYRDYRELDVVVTRQEYVSLIRQVEAIDPNAFVSIYNVSDLMSTTWGKKGQKKGRDKNGLEQ